MSQAAYDTLFSATGRVDKSSGIIRGVCVMAAGILEDRGQTVDQTTLQQLKTACESYSNGVKVRADHKSGIFSTSAVLRNFRIEGNALRADLHALDSDENYDKLMEMAEEIPDTFGLSVSVEQELEERGGKALIRIFKVGSVDLVNDPAACPNGLFDKQLTRRVDATTKIKSMNPEDILKQLTAISSKLEGFETRLAQFEKQKGEDKTGDKIATFEKQLGDALASFDKKISDATDSTVTKVAAEFSKVIGTTVVKAQLVDGAKKEGQDDTKPVEAFEAIVQAEFAKNGGSKSKAMSSAIAADMTATKGKGHMAFLAAGRSVNYSKKS